MDLAIFSVFSALGLKVGVHPIVRNKSEQMGGLSAEELLRGPTVPREGDFVENCLANLNPTPRPLISSYDESTGVLYEEDPDDYDVYLDEREGNEPPSHPKYPSKKIQKKNRPSDRKRGKTILPSSVQNSTARHSTETTARRRRK